MDTLASYVLQLLNIMLSLIPYIVSVTIEGQKLIIIIMVVICVAGFVSCEVEPRLKNIPAVKDKVCWSYANTKRLFLVSCLQRLLFKLRVV